MDELVNNLSKQGHIGAREAIMTTDIIKRNSSSNNVWR